MSELRLSESARHQHRTPFSSSALTVRRFVVAVVVCAALSAVGLLSTPTDLRAFSLRFPARAAHPVVRVWQLGYRTAAGLLRHAYVLLPSWYGPANHPALPLVISPHGRGATARASCRLWGNLPAVGRFAVVCPDGHGARLGLYSWGAPEQIADLARMPLIVHRRLPWLKVNRQRIYGVGGSMGGQEILLLLARYPHLLRGVIAFDSVTNLADQWGELTDLRCNRRCRKQWNGRIGIDLRHMMTREVGGTPTANWQAYAARSPLTFAGRIADSGVPLELWWSVSDLVIPDQASRQSGALFSAIRRLNPHAPVEAFVGDWIHSHEQRSTTRLPLALAELGLLPSRYLALPGRLGRQHFIGRDAMVRSGRDLSPDLAHATSGTT